MTDAVREAETWQARVHFVGAGVIRCFWDPLAISRLVRRRAVAESAGVLCGRLVDVGAGEQPYADLFCSRTTRTIAVEFPGPSPRGPVDVWGDAARLPFRSDCADSLVCAEVLQYLPSPAEALREFARILRTGGHLLVVAPQLRGAGNEVNDYWRFGHSGLRLLARQSGLQVLDVVSCGGICAAIGQRVSSWLFAALVGRGGLPPVLVRLLCGGIQASCWLADQIGIGQGETLHWLLVARKV